MSKDYYYGELDIIYYMALNHKRAETLDFFDVQGIKINKLKKMFVYESAKTNNYKIVKNYLEKRKPNKKNKFLFLLLKIATIHSSFETVEALLEYGVSFKQGNYYCIRMVIKNGKFNLFKLFHKYGLDINKNEYLFAAILKDDKDWFNYMIAKGFEINDKNSEAIYNFLGFKAALSIINEQLPNLTDKEDLMRKSCNYNPLMKKWGREFYSKVAFYNKLNKSLESKTTNIEKKVKKI